jgi:hypothetical protein
MISQGFSDEFLVISSGLCLVFSADCCANFSAYYYDKLAIFKYMCSLELVVYTRSMA